LLSEAEFVCDSVLVWSVKLTYLHTWATCGCFCIINILQLLA